VKKIAAGQVVERPSSVVKELVENSIDAKALNVKVEIENGGVSLIRVTDDGQGMYEKDLLESFKSHTTSKISKEDDLFTLATMGFRGEALSSIASVSQVIIKSRPQGEISGTIIELNEGEMVRQGSIGMPNGTSVSVKGLFYGLPARLKFLKPPSTEFRYIADVMINFAIANPHVGFFLSHNKRIVLDLPSDQTVAERIHMLLGPEMSENIIPVSFEDAHFRVSGFVTRPQIASPIKSKQHFFVNRRPVKDKLVASSVKDAYGTLLPPRNYPPFVLFFELPTSMVDVNIHPKKEKVAFTDPEFVYELFQRAVTQVFDREDVGYEYAGDVDDSLDYYDDLSKVLDVGADEYLAFDKEVPIVQLHKLYLLKQTKNGILLVDQHAAHERVLYESLLEDFKRKGMNNVRELSKPVTFDLAVSDSEALTEYLDEFEKLGFGIIGFGRNTFKLSALPQLVSKESAVEIIEEILESLKEGRGVKTLNTTVKYILSTMACKNAIKSGDYLSVEQREKLLKDLEKTKTKYTCPHGRPVKMELTLNELARMFKRS
jgi:DNA mismatch repair protein MutL